MKRLIIVAIILIPSCVLADEKKMCVSACRNDGRDGPGVTSCFYELKDKCEYREKICVESDTVACHPTYIDLGKWSPQTSDKQYFMFIHGTGG